MEITNSLKGQTDLYLSLGGTLSEGRGQGPPPGSLSESRSHKQTESR